MKTEKQILIRIQNKLEKSLREFTKQELSCEEMLNLVKNSVFDLVEVNSRYSSLLTSIQHCYSEIFTRMGAEER